MHGRERRSGRLNRYSKVLDLLRKVISNGRKEEVKGHNRSQSLAADSRSIFFSS